MLESIYSESYVGFKNLRKVFRICVVLVGVDRIVFIFFCKYVGGGSRWFVFFGFWVGGII